jgi:hypothetical protein
VFWFGVLVRVGKEWKEFFAGGDAVDEASICKLGGIFVKSDIERNRGLECRARTGETVSRLAVPPCSTRSGQVHSVTDSSGYRDTWRLKIQGKMMVVSRFLSNALRYI